MKGPVNMPDDFKGLEAPPFDKKLLIGIKGIDELFPVLPKYKIVLKRADYLGRKEKVSVWVGYFHSIGDSGWNYTLKEVEEYSLIV